MADKLLEIRDLAKKFASRAGREDGPWVIQGLNFSVADGEFLTIVGPSGAGRQRSSRRSTALTLQLPINTMSVTVTSAANTPVVSKFIAPSCTR